jgi:hypothetical protein
MEKKWDHLTMSLLILMEDGVQIKEVQIMFKLKYRIHKQKVYSQGLSMQLLIRNLYS